MTPISAVAPVPAFALVAMAITVSVRENAKNPAVRNGRVPESGRQAAELPLELELELEPELDELEDELLLEPEPPLLDDVEAAGLDSDDFVPVDEPAEAGELLDDEPRLSFR